MTDREVMRQTLLALEGWDNYGKWAWPDTALEQSKRNTTESLASLRAALEQQAEPVHGDIRALRYRIFELEGEVLGYKRMLDVAEAQPQRQPLTTGQRSSIVNDALRGHASTRDAIDWAIRHVECHHRIGQTP